MSTEKITDRKLFSERLKTLRGSRNKAQFSKELGIPAPVYQRYEDGRIPSHDNLSVIAGKCGVTVDWLLGRDDCPATNSTHNRGVMSKTKGSPNSEKAENIEDSNFVTGVLRSSEKGQELHGAAAASALSAQDRRKAAAFGAMDSDEARRFVDLALQVAPMIASGRAVEAGAEILRTQLDSLVAYGHAIEQAKTKANNKEGV